MDISVNLGSNSNLKKFSLKTNNQLGEEYRKLEEIKKIVQKI
jgi:hypothetical protein